MFLCLTTLITFTILLSLMGVPYRGSVGVFAGGEIGGVPGIFLSIPLLALARLVYYETRKRQAISNDPMRADEHPAPIGIATSVGG